MPKGAPLVEVGYWAPLTAESGPPGAALAEAEPEQPEGFGPLGPTAAILTGKQIQVDACTIFQISDFLKFKFEICDCANCTFSVLTGGEIMNCSPR